MPRQRGDRPGQAEARRGAQEAALRGLVADAVTKAHEAQAAAQQDPAGSARAFPSEAALPAVRALNRARAPTMLPAMHRIVSAVQPGLISTEAALYGHWMEWPTSNRSGRPLSMGDTLRLTGAGSAMSLHSSAAALLHALRTRWPGDTAPYLNQARATYPGGVSEQDVAPHLLHPPDEDLEVGEITVFVEGADEAPTRPRPTNPVYAGARPTPPYAVLCEAFPREPTWCPALPLESGMRKHILEKSETRQNNRSFHMKREKKIAHFMKNSLFFEKMRKWHPNQSHCDASGSAISSPKHSLCFSQYGVGVFALLYFLEAFGWLLLLPRALKKCTRPRPDTTSAGGHRQR